MIKHWIKLNSWLNFRKEDVPDTSWFQRQLLKKKYQDKKPSQSYNNQAKMKRSHVRIRLS